MTSLPEWTADDWERLGRVLRAERERRGLSRRALAELSDVSEKSIQHAEEGRVPTRWPQSITAIERALGWAPGSVMAIRNGDEPTALVAAGSDSGVLVPVAEFTALVAIAAHVSAGRHAAFVQESPYPDALARRTLGALDDAGLLPDRHAPEGAP